jgi:hypothetical protein
MSASNGEPATTQCCGCERQAGNVELLKGWICANKANDPARWFCSYACVTRKFLELALNQDTSVPIVRVEENEDQ